MIILDISLCCQGLKGKYFSKMKNAHVVCAEPLLLLIALILFSLLLLFMLMLLMIQLPRVWPIIQPFIVNATL